MTQQKNEICVLLVEDDEDLRLLWQFPLRDAFTDVTIISSAAGALSSIKTNPPDIIISDIFLVGLDGFQLCRKIKEDPKTAGIPVILYSSTYISEKDHQFAMACGAANTLLKDIGIDNLINRINQTLTEDQIGRCLSELTDEREYKDQHIERLKAKLDQLFLQLKEQKKELDITATRFKDFASCMSDYFWETNKNNQVIYSSSGKKSSLLFPQFGKQGQDFFSGFSQFFEGNEMLRLKEEFRKHEKIETHLNYVEGRRHHRVVLMTASPYKNKAGDFSGYRGVFSDITERHRQAEQLYHEATHDTLTGLFNLRGLGHCFQEITASNENDQHVMCYIDLDFFKTVNDTAGHKAGDELLIQVSTLIARQVRKSDITARVGGDEFAILLSRCSLEQAQRLLQALHETISQFRFIWKSRTYQVGASLGVVAIQGGMTTLEEALGQADKACYSAKNSGGNQIYIQQSPLALMTEPLVNEETIEKINFAFANDSFELVRQAISITGAKDKPVGYEILLRLHDGEKQLMPAALIPVIERHQLSARLDEWVCKHVFEWIESNPQDIQGIEFISINLSGSSLGKQGFRDTLISMLKGQRTLAEKICFEITESAAIENMNDAKVFFDALKQQGCRIALDDFGTGFSSLAYLRNLPIDYIKIDGLFVTSVADDEVDYGMLESIQQLAELLHIKTIAEFVENDKTEAKLEQIGIDMTQGYYIGRPEAIALSTTEPQARRLVN